MDEMKKKLRERAKEVLKADIWMCKVCEKYIDANTNVASSDEKSRLLQDHIQTTHKDSPIIDPNLDSEFYVLYFMPSNETRMKNKKLT